MLVTPLTTALDFFLNVCSPSSPLLITVNKRVILTLNCIFLCWILCSCYSSKMLIFIWAHLLFVLTELIISDGGRGAHRQKAETCHALSKA